MFTGQSGLVELLRFTVPGIHVEQYGAKNQPWDSRVRECARAAIASWSPHSQHGWYAAHARWFVAPTFYRQDIDNLRIKPVLDSLTAEGVWPDDNVQFVRRIVSEVELIGDALDQRLEIVVYGADQSGTVASPRTDC